MKNEKAKRPLILKAENQPDARTEAGPLPKAKHTPGPWEIREQDTKNNPFTEGEIQIATESNTLICAVQDETGDDWGALEMGANARLIAAAPELLAALEFVAKMLDDDGGKAQGVMYSDCLSPDSDDMTGLEYVRAAIHKAKGE